MISFSLFLLIGLFAFAAVQASPARIAIRVMSYNIRFDNPLDGENRWDLRKERLSDLIRYHDPDVLGLQEAKINQARDLATLLPQYEWYGVGRDDGQEQGELMAIFYRKERFELLDQGTFWLSPTYQQPSRGWDAELNRICSWVKLQDRESQKIVFHFNTHFDYMGRKSREECARLLLKRIPAIASHLPVILTGDFNDPPQTPFYEVIVEENFLCDARHASKSPHYGPEGTWSTFDVLTGIGSQIDFVFVSPQIEVTKHAFLTDSQQLRYPSDHLPILADLKV